MIAKFNMRLTLSAEEHQILVSALPLIGAKSVAEAVREAVDAQIDAARSLLQESGQRRSNSKRVKNTP